MSYTESLPEREDLHGYGLCQVRYACESYFRIMWFFLCRVTSVEHPICKLICSVAHLVSISCRLKFPWISVLILTGILFSALDFITKILFLQIHLFCFGNFNMKRIFSKQVPNKFYVVILIHNKLLLEYQRELFCYNYSIKYFI